MWTSHHSGLSLKTKRFLAVGAGITERSNRAEAKCIEGNKKKRKKEEDVITVECFSDNKKHRLQKTSEWIEDWLRDKMSNSVLLEDDTARCEPGQEGRQWKRTAQ